MGGSKVSVTSATFAIDDAQHHRLGNVQTLLADHDARKAGLSSGGITAPLMDSQYCARRRVVKASFSRTQSGRQDLCPPVPYLGLVDLLRAETLKSAGGEPGLARASSCFNHRVRAM